MEIILTILIAITGLLSNWFDCTVKATNEKGIIVTRLNKLGYIFLFVIIALTTYSSILIYNSNKTGKERIETQTLQLENLNNEVSEQRKINSELLETNKSLKEELDELNKANRIKSEIEDWNLIAEAKKGKLIQSIEQLKKGLIQGTIQLNNKSLSLKLIDGRGEELGNHFNESRSIFRHIRNIEGWTSAYFSSPTAKKRNLDRIDNEVINLVEEIDRLILEKQPKKGEIYR